ncbi:Prestin [Drechslerella dactyloides]|uniref:Prestin n=1 Tax=Drechslerella dactyloides TaxID=74499 RepID=A0AAD6ITC5_DREDA|nr:Prestin [Drechslerella dactyloides]
MPKPSRPPYKSEPRPCPSRLDSPRRLHLPSAYTSIGPTFDQSQSASMSRPTSPSSPAPANSQGGQRPNSSRGANLYTSLLSPRTDVHPQSSNGARNNGTFPVSGSASPTSSVTGIPPPNMPRKISSFGAIPIHDLDDDEGSIASDGGESSFNRKRRRKMSTVELARFSGVKYPWLMYLSYYVPALKWIPHYDLKFLAGDIVAGVTLASIYIPMALSLAANLAHAPAALGLYAFVIVPVIYAIFGSCPQMVTGPEAAGSLLVGEAVRRAINSGRVPEEDGIGNAIIVGIVTVLTGIITLLAGIIRVGFLDSVLSRALLRGFISAVGVVILVDQCIPELGLAPHAKMEHVQHASSVTKIDFLIRNIPNIHIPTALVSTVSLLIIVVMKKVREKLQDRHTWIVFIPDRFLVVTIATILAAKLKWKAKGIDTLGDVSEGQFAIRFPFKNENMHEIREALPTAFLIAVLGFFESVVAAKSLGSAVETNISSNRELVALGVGNILAGFGCGLPSFGGYGRSKLNVTTGGRTPMSSIVLAFITLMCILFVLPYFKHIPRCVLSAMITSVAFSLLEEAPADIEFFLRIRSVIDLFMMVIVFTLTVFYSLELGIAVGVGLSIVQILQHATRARIIILGRVPDTTPAVFKSAEDFPEEIQQIEGCLIVKIPEPLTFANAGDLKNRLRRLETYGSMLAHPSLPRLRSQEHNKNVVFDVHGMTSIDGSGTQVLLEIVESYCERGVRVYFARGPVRGGDVWQCMENAGIVDLVGGEEKFFEHVSEALRDMEEERDSGPTGA